MHIDEKFKARLSEFNKVLRAEIARPFQVSWMDSAIANRYTLVLSARQIGKSWCGGYLAVTLALGINDGKVNIPPHDVYILSADREKSKLMISIVHQHLDAIQRALGVDLRDPKEGGLERVVLLNGSVITGGSGRPTGAQGRTASVLVDELSITDHNPEDIFAQAISVSSSKPYYRCIIFSNADRKDSFIDKFLNSNDLLLRERREQFNIFRCNIYDAYGPNLPEHILQIKSAISQENWNRFYLNIFTTSNKRTFHGLLDSIYDAPGKLITPMTVLGVDPGFTNNPTGIVKALWDGQVLQVIDSQSWYSCPEDDQMQRIRVLMEEGPPVDHLYIDAGTQAFLMHKRLETIYGSNRVKAVSFNASYYSRCVMELRKLLGEKRLFVPAHLKDLVTDLSLIEEENGKIIVPSWEVHDKFIRHADEAVALMCIVGNLQPKHMQRNLEVFGDIRETFDGRWY